VVGLDEIVAQGGSLNLASYIAKVDEAVIPTVDEAMTELRSALEAAWEAEDRLNALLSERALG
jgi:hypothetical protein